MSIWARSLKFVRAFLITQSRLPMGKTTDDQVQAPTARKTPSMNYEVKTPALARFDTGGGREAPSRIHTSGHGVGTTGGIVVTAAVPQILSPDEGSGFSDLRLAQYETTIKLLAIVNQANSSSGTIKVQASVDGGAFTDLATMTAKAFGQSSMVEYTTPAAFDTLDFRAISTANARVVDLLLVADANNW